MDSDLVNSDVLIKKIIIIPLRIPKYVSVCTKFFYFRMIEDHAKSTNQKCTDILMDEWGTSGRFRPTLSTLKEILIKAQIFRAADEIAIMLNGKTLFLLLPSQSYRFIKTTVYYL